jgi:protein-S-isoprenylcysteine O-methyltransferase Ste14
MPSLYKNVRHPLYLGFIIAFWSAPRMTAGHLFFAVMTTAYILVAIQFEKRDLVRAYGRKLQKVSRTGLDVVSFTAAKEITIVISSSKQF